MTIEFHCPHCDKLLKTADDKAGVQASCPGCGEAVIVPTGSESQVRSDGSFPVEVPGRADDGRAPYSACDSLLAAAGGDGPMRDCPMCGEKIKAAATRCRNCGEDLTIG